MSKKQIFNIETLSEDFVDRSDSKLVTAYLSLASQAKELVVNIDTVSAGAKSCKFHNHSIKEEFFIILSGQGVVRLNDSTKAVKKGDFFSKRASKRDSHQFINTSDEDLVILDISTNSPLDVIGYPDEEVEYHPAKKTAYKKGIALTDWTSNPDQD